MPSNLKNSPPGPSKITVRDLNFYYGKFHALKSINLDIPQNKVTAFIGPSGCGKSTLLYLLSTMDTDYEGQLYIHEELITGKSDKELAVIRNEKIGFVFQFHYLLSEYNVLKNVLLVCSV